jgi:hypothetical protein
VRRRHLTHGKAELGQTAHLIVRAKHPKPLRVYKFAASPAPQP